MQFVPIPTTREYLDATFEHWFPFLEGISRRSKEPINELLAQIARRDVQLALVWNENTARALIGMRFVKRGDDLIGEVVWLTGKGMRQWLQLLPQMEDYLKYMGCVTIRPICRPGWSRLIKGKGYRITHYQMEKTLS